MNKVNERGEIDGVTQLNRSRDTDLWAGQTVWVGEGGGNAGSGDFFSHFIVDAFLGKGVVKLQIKKKLRTTLTR